jgi:hypothetical protein
MQILLSRKSATSVSSERKPVDLKPVDLKASECYEELHNIIRGQWRVQQLTAHNLLVSHLDQHLHDTGFTEISGNIGSRDMER